MAKIPNQINNDEEFNDLCSRMVKCAQMMEDPLTNDEERTRYNLAYDHMHRVLEEYRLRDRGVSFYEPIAAPKPLAQPNTPTPVETPPEQKQEPLQSESKPKANFSSWLD